MMIDLLILLACIIFLVLAITVLKVHPIPALLITGLILGLSIGGSASEVTESILSGFGNTLKWIGLVILFGTLIGEILAATGGADAIADSIIKLFGIKRVPLSMAVIGFLVGIPVFVDVAYLTLLPTIIALSRRSGHSILVLGLALSMSLTAAHGLIPPTPGPLAVAAILEVNIGEIIPLNILVAIMVICGGLLWIKLNQKKLGLEKIPDQDKYSSTAPQLKGIYRILPFAALLMPLVLMSLGNFFPSENNVLALAGNPVWALMVGVIISLPLLKRQHFSKDLYRFMQSAAAKSAIVILITGTGGSFGQVIKDSLIIENLFSGAGDLAALGIILPFVLSLLFTSITGSITVSVITTASILAPLTAAGTLDPALTAAAIGAGSLGIIHVNASYFWLFKELHDLSVSRLLKTLSVLSGVMVLSGGVMLGLIYLFKLLISG